MLLQHCKNKTHSPAASYSKHARRCLIFKQRKGRNHTNLIYHLVSLYNQMKVADTLKYTPKFLLGFVFVRPMVERLVSYQPEAWPFLLRSHLSGRRKRTAGGSWPGLGPGDWKPEWPFYPSVTARAVLPHPQALLGKSFCGPPEEERAWVTSPFISHSLQEPRRCVLPSRPYAEGSETSWCF